MAWGATCVQRLDGSRDSAIHTKYRISLRSSSMREPRYPLPRVVLVCCCESRIARVARERGRRASSFPFAIPWRNSRRGSFVGRGRSRAADPGGLGAEAASSPRCVVNASAGRSARQVSTMILPQVHLRKPCYDFSFL